MASTIVGEEILDIIPTGHASRLRAVHPVQTVVFRISNGVVAETGGSFPFALMTATLSLLDVLGLERCATVRPMGEHCHHPLRSL